MKILFLLSRIEKSGVTLHTLDLAQGLVKQGHQITMITGGVTDDNNEYLIKILDGFNALNIEIKTFKTPKGNIINRILTSISSIFQILVWISISKTDIIHSQSPYMTFLPWMLGKKFITTVHNVQLVENLKYKNPTQLIAISRESKSYAIETLGAKSNRVSVVCHGISKRYENTIPESEKIALKAKYGILENSIIIGFVGRITLEKGLDVLISAVEHHLPHALSDKIHLIFLGDYFNEEDKKWLEDIISKSSIAKQITIVPFQDPKPFYHIFDVFVLPSLSEAFGLVCVEAMMSGCCTIRTDTNGALDQITHGEDGFIFQNGDARELSQIIELIIQNPNLKKAVARKGKEKAIANFTVDAMTSKTVVIYQKII